MYLTKLCCASSCINEHGDLLSWDTKHKKHYESYEELGDCGNGQDKVLDHHGNLISGNTIGLEKVVYRVGVIKNVSSHEHMTVLMSTTIVLKINITI